MAAIFHATPNPELPHYLLLPWCSGNATNVMEETMHGVGFLRPAGRLVLHCRDWKLTIVDLLDLQQLLERLGLELCRVEGSVETTLVAAAALGLPIGHTPPQSPEKSKSEDSNQELTIHRGTLRSGEHLQANGSVLLLGDVNPGARISAPGHVMVWGRLRGIAHAGCHGNPDARIVALQLRPLQLRIAEVVALGPSEIPEDGFTEEARLVNGVIQIDPASPLWPLSE